MVNALETIKKRISVRTYDPRPLEEENKARLEEICKENKIGPFGNEVRFKLLDFNKEREEELRQLKTYGVIKGAKFYVLSAVKEGDKNFEDLGYCLEKVILEATALGYGTCWLGGTFKRASFAAKMHLSEQELLPAITPVGYSADKTSLLERFMRYGAKARKRKPWAEVFFRPDGTPLQEETAGSYRDALEAVRIGPSASNRQPWRIVQEDGGVYRLYLAENRQYNRALGKIRIQNIDMGIAMCHFELVAKEQGHAGEWQNPAQPKEHPEFIHIADWTPKEQE